MNSILLAVKCNLKSNFGSIPLSTGWEGNVAVNTGGVNVTYSGSPWNGTQKSPNSINLNSKWSTGISHARTGSLTLKTKCLNKLTDSYTKIGTAKPFLLQNSWIDFMLKWLFVATWHKTVFFGIFETFLRRKWCFFIIQIKKCYEIEREIRFNITIYYLHKKVKEGFWVLKTSFCFQIINFVKWPLRVLYFKIII